MTNEEFAEALRLSPSGLADRLDQMRGVLRDLEADNIMLRARVKELEGALGRSKEANGNQ